jgi:hypothetical protein
MIRQTSVESYNQIKSHGLLSKRKQAVYDCLYEFGPLTANEIFARLDGSIKMVQANLHARLSELRDSKCVQEVGTSVCTVTGRKALLWDVTSLLPIKIDKKEKIECVHCGGSGLEVEAA